MSADDESSAIRQKLMSAEEVYVYKIPPLKTAGGHRAEDWNLAQPLETCHLLVERRGDVLALDFLHNGGKLFAQSLIDLRPAADGGTQSLQHYLEQVVDSSRYFVVKIKDKASGREALIGFGFRDREKATDLRESCQHYEKSLQREFSAASSTLVTPKIPELKEGEKIHVDTRSGKASVLKTTPATPTDAAKKSSGAVPLLAKKPPPPPPTPEISKMSIQFDAISIEDDHNKAAAAKPKQTDNTSSAGDDDSDNAVYDGDEDEWAAELK